MVDADNIWAAEKEGEFNAEIVRFSRQAKADASDPGIVLWSLEYWLAYYDFSDEFLESVLEPTLQAVSTRRSPP